LGELATAIPPFAKLLWSLFAFKVIVEDHTLRTCEKRQLDSDNEPEAVVEIGFHLVLFAYAS